MISRIHEELGKPVMADVDTIEAAIAAEAAGADLIATLLKTQHHRGGPPQFGGRHRETPPLVSVPS